MQEFTIKLFVTSRRETTVVVRADSADDAEDKAIDLYYQDDGCHGVRDRMEFGGGTVGTEVVSAAPVGTAAEVQEPF